MCGGLCSISKQLSFRYTVDRAHGNAVLTIGLIFAFVAGLRIDDVDISFGDGAGGAFRQTETTRRAIVTYFHCHDKILLILNNHAISRHNKSADNIRNLDARRQVIISRFSKDLAARRTNPYRLVPISCRGIKNSHLSCMLRWLDTPSPIRSSSLRTRRQSC